MKSRYWCANYACPSKSDCMRFLSESIPITSFEYGGEKYNDPEYKNFIEPFISGPEGKLMIPDKSGKCNNFYRKPNSEGLEKPFK